MFVFHKKVYYRPKKYLYRPNQKMKKKKNKSRGNNFWAAIIISISIQPAAVFSCLFLLVSSWWYSIRKQELWSWRYNFSWHNPASILFLFSIAPEDWKCLLLFGQQIYEFTFPIFISSGSCLLYQSFLVTRVHLLYAVYLRFVNSGDQISVFYML